MGLRRKWVYRDGKLREVNPKTYRPRDASTFNGIIPDSAPFETIDGDYIGGRVALKEYEKKNDVFQVGNDYVQPPDHDTAVRQAKESLIKDYEDAKIPLEDSIVTWQTPEEGFDG